MRIADYPQHLARHCAHRCNLTQTNEGLPFRTLNCKNSVNSITNHLLSMSRLLRPLPLVAMAALLSGCATGQLAARASVPMVNSGATAMMREPDPALASSAMPAQIELIRSLVAQLPKDADLRLQEAQGLYVYAYGFVEDHDRARASKLYHRAFNNARVVLAADGLRGNLMTMNEAALAQELQHLDKAAVPALFWTASCWAKWIDMNRDSPALLADMGNAVALMRRADELDGNYYFGGPHLFLGIYYSSRPAALGGNPAKAGKEFAKARAATGDKLLMVDVLQAQYLERQAQNQKAFHALLIHVIEAPPDLFPQMALANAIAKDKAKQLLTDEEAWF